MDVWKHKNIPITMHSHQVKSSTDWTTQEKVSEMIDHAQQRPWTN